MRPPKRIYLPWWGLTLLGGAVGFLMAQVPGALLGGVLGFLVWKIR